MEYEIEHRSGPIEVYLRGELVATFISEVVFQVFVYGALRQGNTIWDRNYARYLEAE